MGSLPQGREKAGRQLLKKLPRRRVPPHRMKKGMTLLLRRRAPPHRMKRRTPVLLRRRVPPHRMEKRMTLRLHLHLRLHLLPRLRLLLLLRLRLLLRLLLRLRKHGRILLLRRWKIFLKNGGRPPWPSAGRGPLWLPEKGCTSISWIAKRELPARLPVLN